MIIHDFYFVRVAIAPRKTNPPLVVNTKAVFVSTGDGRPSVAEQRRLAGDTLPGAILIDPSVREPATPQIGPALELAFFAINTGDDGSSRIHVHGHALIGDLIRFEGLRFDAGQELRLVHHGTVVIHIHERGSEQLVQCRGVFVLFRVVPGGFEGEDPALVVALRRRGLIELQEKGAGKQKGEGN